MKNLEFAIISDSFCELSKSVREKYNIDFVPGHVVLPDGTEGLLNLEWDLMSAEDFYESLKKIPDFYKTSPANIYEVAQKFEYYACQNIPVLCICISSALSGAYNFCVLAKRMVQKKFPDSKIEVIDSLRYGHGHGLMCINAAEMRKNGMGFAQVCDKINSTKNSYHQCGWLDDLSFVAKKKRISNAKAFFGTIAGIKPMGEFDSSGLITVLGNARGEQVAYNVILEYVRNTILEAEKQILLIGYSNRKKQAEILKTVLEKGINPKEVILNQVYMGCGINVGPGLMAVYYSGIPISENLEMEKNLFAECTKKF